MPILTGHRAIDSMRDCATLSGERLESLWLEIETLRLSCAQFERYQREICELLDESTEGDSISLHTNAVYAIKALKERLGS